MILKICLIFILILIYYNFEKNFLLKTNVSDNIIINIFSQLNKNNLSYLINFFSKIINLIKINYEIYNKKILIII